MNDMRRTREQFLLEDLAARDFQTRDREARHPRLPRPDIVNSWQRSLLGGVQPTGIDLPYVTDGPTKRRLLAAASPILDALADELADTNGTVLLADSDARIVDRRVGTRSWMHNLDRHNVAPGFVFAEEYVGTNGIGCALEEERLFEVRGAEHFRDSLQSFVCIAAPIRHPVHNTIEGGLNLTCSLDEYSPFARSVLTRAIHDIEQRLREAASQTERMVLDSFVSRSKRTSRPLVAVGVDVFICNPAASALLERADRDLLWFWAAPALQAHDSVSERLTLTDGQVVRANAARIGERGRAAGALIVLDAMPSDISSTSHDIAAAVQVAQPQATQPPSAQPQAPKPHAAQLRSTKLQSTRLRSTRPGAAGTGSDKRGPNKPPPEEGSSSATCVTGRSAPALAARDALARVVATRRSVVITGEPGSGRRRAALAVLNLRAPDAVPVLLDATSAGWDQLANSAITGGRAVLVRHCDEATAATLHALRHVVEIAEATGIPLAATAADPARLAGVFGDAVAIPPLRSRPHDVRELAAELLAKIAPNRGLRLHPAAAIALERHDWPGNVRELQMTLSLAAQSCIGSELLERHLPESLQQSVGQLTPIERAEREAILAALADADGNKLAAAAALGFARSTLYRKLRALKIDSTPAF
ncbi:sigma-54-dependent Fis family transcriptional regulator [Cumulibacter soli]|uniref:sigma-54-dependent Fis family transcriptional regulator n=1 Tax=Cumulibacter soli TaxID=2546344 RepID=UPI0010679844|nr:helix-turn-helix domain-containing protein [Cumulibacter soli]